MEVDSDDELLESTHLNDPRAKGPPPDVTHNLPSKSPVKSNQLIAKLHRSNEYQPLLNGNMSDDQGDGSDFVHLSCNHFDSDPEFNEIVKKSNLPLITVFYLNAYMKAQVALIFVKILKM